MLRKKILKRELPYFISRKAPLELKSIWFKTLFTSKKHLFYYLYSISGWKILKSFRLIIKILTSNSSIQKKTFKDLLYLTVIDQIPLQYYYYFKLYLKENWDRKHLYLYHHSIVHLLKALNPSSNKKNEILNDKYLFYQFCKNINISTPTIFGLVTSQKATWFVNLLTNHQSFIIKPIRGSKSKGFVRFIFNQNTNTYYSSQGKTITIKNILNHVLEITKKENTDFLIQECLINHNAIASFCNDALATVRILSFIDKNNNIVLFRPIIQIPQGKNVLNYYHTGGFVYLIDIETGIASTQIETPMNVKETALNLEIPFWPSLKKDVIKLHSSLPSISLIGWDVAVTNNGCRILEGNLQPSLDIHQKTPFTPLINTELYDLIIEKTKNNNL